MKQILFFCSFLILIFVHGVTFGQTPQPYPAGSGTSGDPYIISSADHLAYLRDFVNTGAANAKYANTYFKVTADLDLSAYNPWTSIGVATVTLGTGNNAGSPTLSGNYFAGVFDGGGYTISNMTINATATVPAGGNVGLFGVIGGAAAVPAEIRNVALDASCSVTRVTATSSATTSWGVGSLVGYMYNCALVEQCYSLATVVVTAPLTNTVVNAGGLIGCAAMGQPQTNGRRMNIKKCFFGGNISSTSGGSIGGDYVGGIVGRTDINLGGTGNPSDNILYVNECFNFGYVSGNNFVGGIAGSAYISMGTNSKTFYVAVTNCYNSGMVSGNASSAITTNAGGVGGIIGFAGTNQAAAFVMTHNYNTGGVRLTGPSANEIRLANCIGAFDKPTNNSNTTSDINYNFCDILNALTCNIVGQATNNNPINMLDPVPNVTSEMIGNVLIDNASSGLRTISSVSNTNFPITIWYGKEAHYPQLDWAARFAELNPTLPAPFSEMIQAASALSVLPLGGTYYKDRFDVRFRSFNISGTCYVPVVTADERDVTWTTNQTNVDIDNLGELSIFGAYSGPATLTASITLSSTNETLSHDYPVEINNPEGRSYSSRPAWVDAAWDGTAVAGGVLTGRDRLQQFGKWVDSPDPSGVVVTNPGFFDSPTADLEKFCNISNIPQIYEIWYPAQLRALYEMINVDNIGSLTNNMNSYQFYIMQDLDMGNAAWTSIGNTTNYFAGYLNGNENKITNLNVNNNATIPAGLFSYIGGTSTLNAHITSLTISGTVTSTQNNTGGLAGQVGAFSTITDICSEVNVSGTNNVGGIVGAITPSGGGVTVEYSFNKGTVSGMTGIGGIVGSGTSNANTAAVNLSNLFNYGAVTGNTAGGIAGTLSATITGSINLNGCYNTEIIKGANTVGGLAGNLSGTGVTLSNGYNVGNVYATATNASNIGGIAGVSGGNVSNTYNGSWVGAYITSGVDNSATNTGAIIGSNSGSLSNNFYDEQMSNYYKGVGNGSNGSDIAGVAAVSNTIAMTQSSGFGLGSSFFHQAGYYPQLNLFRNYANPTYPNVEQEIREASALSVIPAFLTNPNVAESVDLDFIVRSNTASNTPIAYTTHNTTKIINQGTTSTVVLDVAPVPHLEPILASASNFTRPIEVWNIKESETRRPWWAYDGRVWGGNVMYPEDNDMNGGYSSTTATSSADSEHPVEKKRQEYALYPYECFGYWDEGENEFTNQGSGTEADPFRIYYPAQLVTISRIVNRQEPDFVDNTNFAGLFIKVMAPLNFGGTELDANDVPQPIARNTFPIIGINGGGAHPDCYDSDPNPYATQMNFSGVFDGGGFVMEGIYIAQSSFEDDEGTTHYFNDTYTSTIPLDNNEVIPVVAWGFFGDVEGYTGGDIIGFPETTVAGVNSGVIKYVALSENCIINGEGDFTGSIVGRLKGTLTDCFNYASVSATSGYIGGLAGAIKPWFGYSITGCGAAYPQFIQNSFNRGEISTLESATAIGGIVGVILENPNVGDNGNTTINQVYNTAPVMATTSNNVGGLIGIVENTQPNIISNSFNAGMILCDGNNVGGLAGNGNTGLTIEKSYSSGTIVSPGQDLCVSEYEGAATCRGSIIGNLNGTTLMDLFYDKQMSPYHKGIGCDGGNSDFDGSDITALTTGEFTGKTNPTTYADVKTALGSSYYYKEGNYFSYYPQLTYFYESANDEVENSSWDLLMQLNSGLAAAPIYINEDPYQDVSEVTQDFEFPRANGNDLDTHLIWEATSTVAIDLNITGGYIHLPITGFGNCPRITLTASVSGIPNKIFMFILKKELTQRPWWAYPNRVWGGNCVYVTQDYTQAMKMGDGLATDIGGLNTGEPIEVDLYGLKNNILTKGYLNSFDGVLYEESTFSTPLDPLQETCQRHDQFGYWLDGMEDFSGAKHGLNENDPITIYYPAQLVYLANNVNAGSTVTEGLGFINWNHQTYYGFAGKYITQMAILDMGGLVYEDAGSCNSKVTGVNECNAFTPIGLGKLNGSTQSTGLTGSDVFRGSYNGNGYYLRNLYINDNENKYVGLFGIADGVEEFDYDARINHLFLASGSINSSAAQYTGSIVGWAGPSLFFDNAVNVANVTAIKNGGGIADENSRVVVGGIIGASHSTLTHCGNLGSVSGVNTDATGGIAGYMHAGGHGAGDLTMSQCQTYGMINGNTNTGGIVGYFDVTNGGATATIEGSFVKQVVRGKTNIGGIVGQTAGSGNHIIDNCYMYAAVKFNNVVSPEYIGSILGKKGANTVLTSNFYSIQHSQYQGEGLSDGSYGNQALDDGTLGILGDINSSVYLNPTTTPPWAQLFGYYTELNASRNSNLDAIYYGLETNATLYNRLISGFSAIYSLPLYLADDEVIWNLTKDFELSSLDYPGNLYPTPYPLSWSAYLTSNPTIPFGEITGTAPSQIQPGLGSAQVYTFHLPLTTQPVTFNLFVTDDNAGPECTHRELLELIAYKNTDTTKHRICLDSLLVLAPYFYEDPALTPYTFQWYEWDGSNVWNPVIDSINVTFTVDVAATGKYGYKCEIKDQNSNNATYIAEVTVVACMGCSDPAILKINKLTATTDCGFSTYTIAGILTGATDLYVEINGTDTELIPLDSDNFTYSLTVAAGTPVSLDFTAPSTDNECPPAEITITLPKE